MGLDPPPLLHALYFKRSGPDSEGSYLALLFFSAAISLYLSPRTFTFTLPPLLTPVTALVDLTLSVRCPPRQQPRNCKAHRMRIRCLCAGFESVSHFFGLKISHAYFTRRHAPSKSPRDKNELCEARGNVHSRDVL